MNKMEKIRNELKKRINILSENEKIKMLPEWFSPPFPSDSILTNWKDENAKRVMRLQEADEDEILEFGYAIGKSGLNYEYDDLLIYTINSNDKSEVIFNIYKMWFIENKSPKEMEKILEEYEKKYND